jgi:hypothetical protein
VTDRSDRATEPSRLGRILRMATGADESILGSLPAERPRYTAMGGVVLGTALMAMFSMSVALYCVFGEFVPAAFLFVPVWGMFILFLDRWLMASTSAKRAGERFRKLFPRFLLATVFGVIIAEPLLLGVFHTAIEQRIRDDRESAILGREAILKRCNPVPGTDEARRGDADAADCREYRLGVTSASEAKQKELDQAVLERDKLKGTIDTDTTAVAGLEQKAREECVGTSGPGLTGQKGEGPNCKRLRGEVDRYRADHRISENTQHLTELNGNITDLTTEVGKLRASAAGDIDRGIDERVDQFRTDQSKQIGLLERLRTLGVLVTENGYVLSAEWALRVFFVVVDSLPVLLKFLSGFTAYDTLSADRLQRQNRAQRVVNETVRRDTVLREELARHQLIAEHAAGRNKVEFDARIRHLDVDVLREDLIDRRAAHLLGDSPTIPISRPPADNRERPASRHRDDR